MPTPDTPREELLEWLKTPQAPDQEKHVRRFLMERDAQTSRHPIQDPQPGFRENLEKLLPLLSPEVAEELFLSVRVLIYLCRLGEASTLLSSRGLWMVPREVREEAMERLGRHAAPLPLVARLLLEEGDWREEPCYGEPIPPDLAVTLENSGFTVGRSRECDLPLSHGSLARQHARFHIADGAWRVEDLGRGVWVNGFRVDQEPLDHGDLVQVAHLPFRFEYLWPPRPVAGHDDSTSHPC